MNVRSVIDNCANTIDKIKLKRNFGKKTIHTSEQKSDQRYFLLWKYRCQIFTIRRTMQLQVDYKNEKLSLLFGPGLLKLFTSSGVMEGQAFQQQVVFYNCKCSRYITVKQKLIRVGENLLVKQRTFKCGSTQNSLEN